MGEEKLWSKEEFEQASKLLREDGFFCEFQTKTSFLGGSPDGCKSIFVRELEEGTGLKLRFGGQMIEGYGAAYFVYDIDKFDSIAELKSEIMAQYKQSEF